MSHLDDGLIHELVDGEVPSTELAPIQAHLATCASCRDRLDTARGAATEAESLLASLDEDGVEAPAVTVTPLPRRQPHWGRHLARAASLVLAAGVGYAARGSVSELVPGWQATTTNGEQVATPTTTPVTAAAPVAGEREAANDAVATTAPAEAVAEAAAPPPAPARAAAERREAVAVAPRVAAAPPGRQLADDDISAESARRRADPAAGVAVQQEFAAQAKAVAAPREVDISTAIELLGGSLRLIDGLVPERLEAIGDEVRLIYPVGNARVQLVQRRDADSLIWRLTAPAGFPADSLAMLRARVSPE